jgi:hypothetical protein
MVNVNLRNLESLIQRLLEERFARLFEGRLSVAELASVLARAMQANLLLEGETPLAPTEYAIALHPADQAALLEADPALTDTLSALLLQLAGQVAVRLRKAPTVTLTADDSVAQTHVRVEAWHKRNSEHSTKALEPVVGAAPSATDLRNPQLIVNGSLYIPLTRPVINIGRRRDNHIVVDSMSVSRAHAQLRLRHGRYTLFDLGSTSGTWVNNQRVSEGVLKPGDVIKLGEVMLVYVEDDETTQRNITAVDHTQPFPPTPPQDQ